MSISHSKNDTSRLGALSQPSSLRLLIDLAKISPFNALVKNLKQQLGDDWSARQLGSKLANDLKTITNADTITCPHFIAQDEFDFNGRCYEEIIYQDKTVPTRDNWHDFYNAMIWRQFPLTKAYLNQLHYQQISAFGPKKRTPVRDRITHFDECGMVIITNDPDLELRIANHDWRYVFVESAQQWHRSILPVIVGHALWEMLMTPFIGLTAKVKVCCFTSFSEAQLTELVSMPGLHNHTLDKTLVTELQHNKDVEQKKPWLPLPLLGIPNWSQFEQNQEFYANTKYFMPKRVGV